MSFDRAACAVALTTVDDVTGYAYRPAPPKPGDAWPFLTGLQRDEATALWVYVTRVFVFLPQDEREASDWIDAHAEALVEAMHHYDIGYVVSLDPVRLAGTNQYALEITMRSE